MIYTRFGTPIHRIDAVDLDKAEVRCQVKGDVEWHRYQLADLKADGGVQEILDAAQEVVSENEV